VQEVLLAERLVHQGAARTVAGAEAAAALATHSEWSAAMAGYLFLLDNEESLKTCIEQGCYSTKISDPRGHWSVAAEGTFADYATMRPGDSVYFFIKRRVYGIGELIDVEGDCRHLNYPGASAPRAYSAAEIEENAVIKTEPIERQRWVCFFKPSPYFFTAGVDMDDILTSNPPAFKMLRAMWKVSFIKFDDVEEQAFRDAILKANQLHLDTKPDRTHVYCTRHEESHVAAAALLRDSSYRLSAEPVVEAAANGPLLRHEMALEAGILDQLSRGESSAIATFGRWDYLSHQVIASPFKPIDYMDKMDLFGYRYIPEYRPTISKYLVGEIKTGTATIDDVEQALKYVDWVSDEYAHGDYSMIEAFLVAASFSDDCISQFAEHARRMFTLQRRPARTVTWRGLRLVCYTHVGSGRIAFDERLVPDEAFVQLNL
jgi:hypothetical protein